MKGQPIWLKNKREVPNLQAGFRCDFYADKEKLYQLRITGATFYRIFLNGRFIGYGPARAGYGYVKLDLMQLPVCEGKNKLAVEAAGYHCASFYTRPEKSFLCAEILEDGEVIKYTGHDFHALSLEKLRNIYAHRYSFQRAYGEVWNFDQSDLITHWTTAENLPYEKCSIFKIQEEYIERNLPMPDYHIIHAQKVEEYGRRVTKSSEELKMPRYFTNVSNRVDGYLMSEWTEDPVSELYGDFLAEGIGELSDTYQLEKDQYMIFKFPTNNTGFLMNQIRAKSDSKICLFFSEYNYGNGMIFESLEGQCNIVTYNLKESNIPYELETFEPYVCQYLGIAVLEGKIDLQTPKLREYSYPEYENLKVETEDEKLNQIIYAAINTFRQNTLDVFMDCPGRERAGWLCDSYFTAQSERIFTGKNLVEKAFLENYVMAKEFPNIPAGMMPHNYPSSTKGYNSGYIPQWAMWYVVELGEYCQKRTGEDPEKYKRICYDLLEWLERYENSDGLLERMPGWNFVEWSKANDWTWDVNYPTNMLYSKMLSVMGELYADQKLSEKSETLRKKIVEQSFTGSFFIDNAVREKDGELHITTNCSETCQYYAYFFGIANKNEKCFQGLTDRLIHKFGPKRKISGEFPEIAYSNAFIGNYLRIIILLRMHCYEQALEDIYGYFGNMAQMTGTLWEYDDLEKAKQGGSLNHGFASFAGAALFMALCGISDMDFCKKTISYDEKFIAEKNFEALLGTEDGNIQITQHNGIKKIAIPEGWKINYER